MKPLVLMYNLKSAAQVDALCREIGAQAQVVPPQRQGLTLGALAGQGPVPVRYAAGQLSEPPGRPARQPTANEHFTHRLVGLLPETGNAGPVPGEMLVLCYFDQDLLDSFLQGFRRRQIPPIPRKAMLTPTNAAWTGPQLYENLTQEMQAMKKR